MPDITPLCRQLHDLFNQLTERDVRLTMKLIFKWDEWSHQKDNTGKCYGPEELRLVIEFIKRKIKAGRRREESLRFDNLIEDTERFALDLADARAEARRPKVNHAKASVLKATGRSAETKTPDAMPVAQIMHNHQRMAQLLAEYKKTL